MIDKRSPGPPTPLWGGPEVVAQTETTGIGGGEERFRTSGTDLERVEAEIRILEAKLQGLKKGGQRP